MYLKITLILIWLILCSIAGVVSSLFRWGDLNLDHDIIHIFSRGVLWLTGIRVDVKGLEHLESSQPCVYVSNHQSAMDIVTFGAMFPRRTVFVVKKSLFFAPFLGLFIAAGRNIAIDRKHRGKAMHSLSKAARKIREEKASVWVFAEGTRNRTEAPLLPFKKGAFHLASEANVPVVPVVSSRLGETVSWKSKILKPGVVTVKVLPPIRPKGSSKEDVEALITEVRLAMERAVGEIALADKFIR